MYYDFNKEFNIFITIYHIIFFYISNILCSLQKNNQ
jgi:hypothetical protein